MPRRKQSDSEFVAAPLHHVRLTETQRVLKAFTAHARGHQTRGRFAEHDFAMVGHVIRMGVTDEDQFFFRPVWIEPKSQMRKIDPAFAKLKFECRHVGNLDGGRSGSKRRASIKSSTPPEATAPA